MNYVTTSINTSPTIVEKAGAAITEVRGYAMKFDDNGNVVVASAPTDTIVGIGILATGTEGAVTQGADVDIQIHGIGLVIAGGTFAKGAALSVNTSGQFVSAGSNPTVAIALEAAAAAGQYVPAILKA